ncbi:MAG: hypothetical protein ACXWCA_03720, partial [Kaistella sp.]
RKKIKDAEKHAQDMERKVNSPAFRKKIEEAEKRAKEVEKQINSAEFQQRIKDAENAARDAVKNASVLDSDVKILIDGKQVTRAEMEGLSPDRIEKMNVIKKGYNGSKANEIHITTKK